jgi:transcriptional regulator with XRE-family HTH domain
LHHEQTMSIVEYVGGRIRELRGKLSQEALAQKIGTTANTISRWETAVYRPTLDDLERLARCFDVSILEFFPPEERPEETEIKLLLRAAKQLSPEDIEELRKYAEYRKARSLKQQPSKIKNSRKGKKAE